MATKAYFENIKKQIAKQLYLSNKSVKVAVAWFTDIDLFNILYEKAKAGLRIEILIANHSINHESRIDFARLIEAGGKIHFIGNGIANQPIMHHKFCIIDNEILIIGSFNWTNKASSNNESITIINEDLKIILDYNEEFEKLRYFQIDDNFSEIEVENKVNVLKLEGFFSYKGGLGLIKRDGKFGFINKNGAEVIKCKYDSLSHFENGYAECELNHRKGFIDKKENIYKRLPNSPIFFKFIPDYEDSENEYGIGGFNLLNKEGDIILKYESNNNPVNNPNIHYFEDYFIFNDRLFGRNGERLIKEWRKLIYDNEKVKVVKFDNDDDYYDHLVYGDYKYDYFSGSDDETVFYEFRKLTYIGEGFFLISTISYPTGEEYLYVKNIMGKKLCQGFNRCNSFYEGFLFIDNKYSTESIKEGYFINSNGFKFSISYYSDFGNKLPRFSSGLAVICSHRKSSGEMLLNIYDLNGALVARSSQFIDDEVTYIYRFYDFYENIAFIESKFIYVIKYNASSKTFEYLKKNGEKVRFRKKTEAQRKEISDYSQYIFNDGLCLVRFENNDFDSIVDTDLNEVFKLEYIN